MTATEQHRPRLESIDLVRGLIMIVMALDHTRDFFGMFGANPTDLATTTPALFMTRWITHFCAPTFFLLTGVGAGVSLRRKTTSELSRFLVSRGLWIVFLEAFVMRAIAYQFNLDYKATILIVLWALGWAMVSLSALVWLPAWFVGALGAVMVAGHNLFDGIRSASPWLAFLHRPGFLINTPEHTVFIAYPLIPWAGVTMLGFALAKVFEWEPERRRALLVRMGLACIAVFFVLRWSNIYGDPSRWSHQATTLFTVISFFNTTKQAPSLLFLLMTLGPVLLLLALADRGTPSFLKPAVLIGRVPLFYFIAHFFTLHVAAIVVCFFRYGAVHWMFESPDLGNFPFTPPPDWGYSLPVVYAVWISVVIALYPLCQWFAALKQRRRDVWLSYL